MGSRHLDIKLLTSRASLLLDMAHKLVAASLLIVSTVSATTCPGFPGYCSESFPGQTCNVVCSFGRNNVPLCQEDGSWTDIPRCIEHEPGVEEQIPGLCPGISGYCSQGFLNHECKFDCATGPDINSVCTADGTWQPYPTCQGDLRDTRDGCDGCPGPLGGKRNRTAEAILGVNPATNNRVPKTGSVQAGSSTRKNVPSFAGNIKFGALQPKPATTNTNNRRARPEDNFVVDSQGRIQARQPATARLPAQVAPAARQPVQVARQPAPVPPQPVRPQPQQQQQRFPTFQQQQQQQQFVNLQQQQQQRNFRPQQPQQPLGGFQQQNAFQQPQQRPSSFQQQPPQALTGGLFDQIKSRIQQGNRQRAQQQQQQQQQLQPQAAVPAAPQSAARAPAQPAGPTFGPFRAVDFGNALAREEQQSLVGPSRPNLSRRPSNNDNFFGEFATVNL